MIASWTSLIDYLQVVMTHEPAEHFRMLFLDMKNILIKDEVQSQAPSTTPAPTREVVKRALEARGIRRHHGPQPPLGRPDPVKPDIEMTRQVVTALAADAHHRPRPRHRRQEPPHQLQVERVDMKEGQGG
ncbi:MAG: JAB domain-containing protein [Geminicoccaceae bacterium]